MHGSAFCPPFPVLEQPSPPSPPPLLMVTTITCSVLPCVQNFLSRNGRTSCVKTKQATSVHTCFLVPFVCLLHVSCMEMGKAVQTTMTSIGQSYPGAQLLFGMYVCFIVGTRTTGMAGYCSMKLCCLPSALIDCYNSLYLLYIYNILKHEVCDTYSRMPQLSTRVTLLRTADHQT